MARALSEAKRKALLSSAVQLIADEGLGASTAKIARGAGLAEGTLFTYFSCKDELLNQLFLQLETSLADSLIEGLSATAAPKERVEHVWKRLIDWGVAHPLESSALRQLKLSTRISSESRTDGATKFREIREMLEQALIGYADARRTTFYIDAVMYGLAETTLDAISASPQEHQFLKQAAFDLFWKGVAR